MENYIITITAEGDDLIVKNNENMRQAGIRWEELSNTAPGLKYRSECIAELRRLVDGDPIAEFTVSPEAEALIEKVTEAARQLY